jgi:hypothetical protein
MATPVVFASPVFEFNRRERGDVSTSSDRNVLHSVLHSTALQSVFSTSRFGSSISFVGVLIVSSIDNHLQD